MSNLGIKQIKHKQIRQHPFAALDIGSSKVCFVIAQLSNQGELSVMGLGEVAHKGVSKGAIVHIDATIKAIVQAKQEAEAMAACKVDRIWLSICGNHIRSFSSEGVVAVRNKEVSPSDIKRVLDATRMMPISSDEKVLHTLPQSFTVDAQDGIENPLGMFCVRLKACAHIVVGNTTAFSNYMKCANKAGLKVESLVLSTLASAEANLTEDEKKLGVVLVDIGAETTKVACYLEGRVVATGFLPFGGSYFTKDIAVGLRTSSHQAEEIKKERGCVLREMVRENEFFSIEGVHGKGRREMASRDLADILFPRAEEFFVLLNQMLKNWKSYPHLGAGLVLTGGTSLLPGFIELAEFELDISVRLGLPFKLKGLGDMLHNPSYSTVLGLVELMEEVQKQDTFASWHQIQPFYSPALLKVNNPLSALGAKMKAFLSEFL